MIQSLISFLTELFSTVHITSLIIASIVGIFTFNKIRKFSNASNLIKVIQSIFIVLVIYTILQFTSPAKEIQQQQEATKILTVGTTADFPPFATIHDGNIAGFDIDIAKTVAAKLGKELELKDMPFTALIPQIQLGKIQLIAAGMTATPERAKRVFFTEPYFTGDPLIVITLAKNKIEDLDDLLGKEVIVNDGYTADIYMSDKEGPILRRLKSPAEAFLAIKTERAFAFVTAQATVQPFFERYGKKDFSIFTIPDTDENISLAISMRYPELQVPIQQALDEMKEDGTIDALKKKWKLI
jgi:arginine/lysine/histidine transporter system substrate-binding protein